MTRYLNNETGLMHFLREFINENVMRLAIDLILIITYFFAILFLKPLFSIKLDDG